MKREEEFMTFQNESEVHRVNIVADSHKLPRAAEELIKFKSG